MVVMLPLASVKVEPPAASSVAGAGLPDVPLLVQPCSWSALNSSVVRSGCVIVPTLLCAVVTDRDQVRHRVFKLGQRPEPL